MFGQFGMGEMLLLVIVGLFVFGPERLPTIARDAAKLFKQLRDQAHSMRDDLQAELGPELGDLDLKSLNPKTMVQNLLTEDGESAAPRKPGPVLNTGEGPVLNTGEGPVLNTGEGPVLNTGEEGPVLSTGEESPMLNTGEDVSSEIDLTKPVPAHARSDETPYDGDAT
ncbi:MAG: sec-independent protein translocase protein TatB [Frankiaceae bacterium]|nr:sec-independent protein translocase protein TatB [Frankiaceae bacterium]